MYLVSHEYRLLEMCLCLLVLRCAACTCCITGPFPVCCATIHDLESLLSICVTVAALVGGVDGWRYGLEQPPVPH